jgi:alkylation response protein AidB-like acyl-CoA dehydrogenase
LINWDEDQRALRAGLATWCEALSADHVEQDARGVFPWDKWKLIQECGILRLPFDECWGGLG